MIAKKIAIGFLLNLAIFFVISISTGFAAEGGARPISMGGAFVALADDTHATSWNPAGLAWQEEKEFTYTGLLTERSEYITADFITDNYLSYSQPLKGGYEQDFKKWGGIGVYFQHCAYEVSGASTKTYEPGLSYGVKVADNISLGVSLSYKNYEIKLPGVEDSDSVFGINFGFLWYFNDNLNIGALWENLNEPAYTLLGVKNKLVRVLRPGIAYFFSEDTVLTLDVYDLTGNTEDRSSDFSQDIRVGLEHYIFEDVAVRLGAHQLNSDVDTSKFYSFGLGWQRSDFLGIYPVSYYLDYTLVYWTDPLSTTEDYTHQIGVAFKF